MNSDKHRAWMLVDDDEAILQLLPALLQTLTDAPIECFNRPQAALAAFISAPEQYELVITDFEMPDMNGSELCREILTISPSQKVLLATGSGQFTRHTAKHAGFTAMLSKPFPLSALQSALAKAFGNSPSEMFHPLEPGAPVC